MNTTDFLQNKAGHLCIDDLQASSLVAQYGSPLYVMSESFLEQRLSEIQNQFMKKYPNTLAIYASKAFSIQAMYRLIQQYGLGVDVVSAGEIFVALQAGFDNEKIYFHGSNKGIDEIAYAIDAKIGYFIVDNFYELEQIERIAAEKEQTIKILLRLVPQIAAGGHEYIQTGSVDTKFGFSTHDDTYLEAIKRAQQSTHIQLKGIHAHVGSQITNINVYKAVATVMMDFVAIIQKQFDYVCEVVNVGGGYAIDYEPGEGLDFAETIDAMMTIIIARTKELKIDQPQIIIEPGRFLVGPAGVTLYTVGSIKTIRGVRTYVSIDGGMTDNIRPALYHAQYEALAVDKLDDPKLNPVTIAGKCCESGDILIEQSRLPKMASGDIIAVLKTGAYNYAMSSNYNQLLRPAVVFTNKGISRLVVARQTFEDLISKEIV